MSILDVLCLLLIVLLGIETNVLWRRDFRRRYGHLLGKTTSTSTKD
jgi:hypothetical protein